MPSTVLQRGSAALMSAIPSMVSTRGADVVAVAGADREDQRIEDDVLGLDAVALGQNLVRALGDRELARARDRLRLLLVFVDTADHQRRAVAARERHHALETFFAVLEVDRIDDRLARRALERLFDRDGVGRIDHQRNFYLLDLDFEKAGKVGDLVAVGVLQTDVEHVGAAAHLQAADLRRLLQLALRRPAA